MSHLPNPFRNGESNSQEQGTPRLPSTPRFLMMTRPPSGVNSLRGQPIDSSSNNFIPFSTIDSKNNNLNNQEGHRRSGGGRGRFNRGGGGGRHFHTPYQQTPARGGSHLQGFSTPHDQGFHGGSGRMKTPHGQNFMSTPRGRGNRNHYGNNRFGDRQQDNAPYNTPFNNPYGDRGNFTSNGRNRGGHGERTPISEVPIDKFVSQKMVEDPWADLEDLVVEVVEEGPESSPVVASLDDSEIVIDSDASGVIDNSYDEGNLSPNDGDGDSSPVHDTGSDSPNVATSSTSEKDTGSDSLSDA